MAPPRTWAQLREAARRLTRPGRKGLVMEAQFERWGAFLPGAGGWLTDAGLTRMTANTPQVREGFGFLAGLHRDGLAATPGQLDAGWSGEALARGRAAMAVEGTWLAGAAAKDFPHLRWAAVPVSAAVADGEDGGEQYRGRGAGRVDDPGQQFPDHGPADLGQRLPDRGERRGHQPGGR